MPKNRMIRNVGAILLLALGALFHMPTLSGQEGKAKGLQDITALLNSRPDSAIALARKSLLKYNHVDTIKAKASYYMGIAYYYKGMYYVSADYYKQALDTEYASDHRRFRGKCHNNLGIVYEYTRRFKKAMDHYLRSMKIDSLHKDSAGVAQSRINLGVLYQNMNQSQQARKYLQQAYAYFKRTKNSSGMALALHNMGKIAIEKGDYTKAQERTQKALTLYQKAGNHFEYASLLNYLSYTALQNQQWKKAANLIAQTIRSARQHGYAHIHAFALLNKARLALHKQNWTRAQSLLDSLPIRNKQIKRKKQEVQLLINYYAKDFAAFEDAFNNMLFRRDSLESNANKQMVNELHIKYQTERKRRQIQEQQKELQKGRQRIWGLTAVLALILSLLITSVVLYNRLQKNYRKLYKKEEKSQNNFFRAISQAREAASVQPAQSNISRGNQTLWQTIIKLISEEELYTQPNLSLSELARRCGSNTTYVSQTIRDEAGVNFKSFINQFRVEKAKALLQKHPQYTQETIAEESGFNSPSSFYRVFKDQTGLTPSKYVSLSRDMQSAEQTKP